MVKTILKLEGLAILIFSLYFYQVLGGNWILFILLLLIPDVSIAGYLSGKKFGAISYNLVHNFFTGFAVVTLGFLLNQILIQQFGIIILAHVGMDRFFGFGLKYWDDFKKNPPAKTLKNLDFYFWRESKSTLHFFRNFCYQLFDIR